MTRQFFVGGNFKLNPTTLQAGNSLVEGLNKAELDPTTGEYHKIHSDHFQLSVSIPEVVIAPPTIYLIPVKDSIRKDIKIAAQNCYFKESGAFTGEIRQGDLFKNCCM